MRSMFMTTTAGKGVIPLATDRLRGIRDGTRLISVTDMDKWNNRCDQSIRKEKMEAEARYGIRFGQTEVYCVRCGNSWGYGKHTCQDMRLKRLNEAQKGRTPIPGRVNDSNAFGIV